MHTQPEVHLRPPGRVERDGARAADRHRAVVLAERAARRLHPQLGGVAVGLPAQRHRAANPNHRRGAGEVRNLRRRPGRRRRREVEDRRGGRRHGCGPRAGSGQQRGSRRRLRRGSGLRRRSWRGFLCGRSGRLTRLVFVQAASRTLPFELRRLAPAVHFQPDGLTRRGEVVPLRPGGQRYRLDARLERAADQRQHHQQAHNHQSSRHDAPLT